MTFRALHKLASACLWNRASLPLAPTPQTPFTYLLHSLITCRHQAFYLSPVAAADALPSHAGCQPLLILQSPAKRLNTYPTPQRRSLPSGLS